MTLPELIKKDTLSWLKTTAIALKAANNAGSKRPGGCRSKERVMKREGTFGHPVKG